METLQPTILSREELPFYIHPKTYSNLIKSRNIVVKGNQDRVYTIDGREGRGKSTLARQLAFVVDPTICLDRIVFNAQQFEDAIKKAKKYQAIIFDEAFRGLSNKSALSKENKKLVTLLMECRKRNLFIFIVLPSFFLLEKYVAIFRSSALFHVVSSKKNYKHRGYKIYNYEKKKQLYIFGKSMLSYYRPKVLNPERFYGKFPPTISEEEYDAKADKAFKTGDFAKKKEFDSKHYVHFDDVLVGLKKVYNFSSKEIVSFTDFFNKSMTARNINYRISKRTQNSKKEERKNII